jgi:hypothetical protein
MKLRLKKLNSKPTEFGGTKKGGKEKYKWISHKGRYR